MTGAAATKYEWTINDVFYADSESITVPSTAREGDEITVTVTNEAGDTAFDTVYVVEDLALISVEAADLDQRKVLIAYFSEPVGDLQPGDIQIRRVSDNKLNTVESLIMSSDKKTATLKLVGYESTNVQGLTPNVEYNMIVTTSDGTASKIFTIPGVLAEATVTTVDSSKSQIELGKGGYDYGLYTIGDAVEVDYNEILGRTVTVQYDKNNVIQELTPIDESVIYGAFKLDDDNIKDQATGTKYPISNTTVGSIYETRETNLDGEGFLLAGNNVDYAKVVLNGNGSVRSIISITDFENVVYVAGVSGTDLLNVKGTATTLKGYNIFKDGKTITIDDIEAGDVVFIDTTKKNAEVYNDSVEGKMTVYTGKIDVDGTRYDTKGNLVANGKDVPATDANLKEFSGSNVEVFFARTGDVAKIVVTDAIVNSTSKFVVLTEDAKLAVNGSTQTLEFKAGDGESVEKYTIDLSKLESVVSANGEYAVKGSKAGLTNDNESANTVTGVAIKYGTYHAETLSGVIVAKDKNGELTNGEMITVPTDLKKGKMVSLTTKEDGTITGISLAEKKATAATADQPDETLNQNDLFNQGANKTFKAGYTSVKTKLLPSTTPVLVYYPDSKDVKVVKYSDVDFTFDADENDDGYVRYDGAKTAAIVIDAKKAGIAAADVNKKHAIIVGATFDQSSTKKLVDLTVAFETDDKVVYDEMANDILETSLTAAGTTTYADWKPGTYVEIEETKANGKLTKVTAKNADVPNIVFGDQDKSEFIVDAGHKLITADDAGIPTTIVTLSSDGKTVKAISWSDYCDYDATKIAKIDGWAYAGSYIDVLRVTLGAGQVAAATFTSDAGKVIAATTAEKADFAASTAATKLKANVNWLPSGVAIDSYAWYKKPSATEAAVKLATATGRNTEELTFGSDAPADAGTIYYLVVTGDDGEKYTSPTVVLRDPTFTLSATSFSATYGTPLAASTVTVADEFGFKPANFSWAVKTTSTTPTNTTSTTVSAAAGTPGIAYTTPATTKAGVLTLGTVATTNAGTYTISVYNQTAGTIDATKRIGEITLTVAPKALASGDITATLTTVGVDSGAAEVIDIADGTNNGDFTAADLDTVVVLHDGTTTIAGTKAALKWTQTTAAAPTTAVKVTVTGKGNYTGSLTFETETLNDNTPMTIATN